MYEVIMKKGIRLLFLLILCILIGLLSYFVYETFFVSERHENIIEEKSVQDELYGTWIGVDGSYLEIMEDSIQLTTQERVYQIPYDVDETSDVKIKLKVNNPYEFFIYSKEGARVLSGFCEDENENYIISNEFVSSEEDVDLSNFESEYKKRYEQSMFGGKMYALEDALDAISFLGKTKKELKIENQYISNAGNFYSINMTTSLFGVASRGVMYSEVDGNKSIDDLCMDEIDLYSNENYESIYSQFLERYPLKEEGQEEYAIREGGSVIWSTFEGDKYTIHVTHGSEVSYVMIQIKRKE